MLGQKENNKNNLQVLLHGSAVTNPTRIDEDSGLIPGIAMGCGVGYRLSLDPALLWL